MKDGCGGAQSARVNSELPNLTRQSTQRRAVVDPEARVPRSIPVRKECANNGHRGHSESRTPQLRTNRLDPARNIRPKQPTRDLLVSRTGAGNGATNDQPRWHDDPSEGAPSSAMACSASVTALRPSSEIDRLGDAGQRRRQYRRQCGQRRKNAEAPLPATPRPGTRSVSVQRSTISGYRACPDTDLVG